MLPRGAHEVGLPSSPVKRTLGQYTLPSEHVEEVKEEPPLEEEVLEVDEVEEVVSHAIYDETGTSEGGGLQIGTPFGEHAFVSPA